MSGHCPKCGLHVMDGCECSFPPDEVNSPDHYTAGGLEAIDVMKAKLTPEEFRGYCKGSMLKYLMRANYKGKHNQDCDKTRWYAEKLMEAIDEATAD